MAKEPKLKNRKGKGKKSRLRDSSESLYSMHVRSKLMEDSEEGEENQNPGNDALEAIADAPDALRNVSKLSKHHQKKQIQEQYQALKKGQQAAGAAAEAASGMKTSGIGNVLDKWKEKGIEVIAENPHMVIILGLLAGLIIILSSLFSSCGAMTGSVTNVVVETSYTATDEDILGANQDYSALESALSREIDRIETTHPGYDEYRYDVDEIGHDPYQLASYLTVLYEAYTRDQVQETLQTLFDLQYTLTLRDEVEIRTRTETRTDTRTVVDHSTDPPTITTEEYEYEVEVEYEYRILNVELRNSSMAMAVNGTGITEDQYARYAILNQTQGNRPYLFENDAYVARNPNYLVYDVPGAALSDARFANMIREAEKYLGYPYVWGGSSPSTSFDCSGFVSYVINHCGNGWDIGRRTANGLKNYCSIIPESAARPGDLIFFQGTYDTAGASHVGIVVDPANKVMIHCGNPISYAYYNSRYWTQHFYCIGRLP